MIFKPCSLIVTEETHDWCRLPYPDHPKGCPMYGTRDSCPPKAPMIGEILDLGQPTYVIAVEFNLKNHVAQMKRLHPDWTDAQSRNPRYWQSTARKELKKEIEWVSIEIPNLFAVMRPEAHGVDLAKTIEKSLGIVLEFPPKNKAYQIAVMGTRKVSNKLSRCFE